MIGLESLYCNVAHGTGFVFKRINQLMDKIKAPAAHQVFLEWIKVSDIHYSIHNLDNAYLCIIRMLSQSLELTCFQCKL